MRWRLATALGVLVAVATPYGSREGQSAVAERWRVEVVRSYPHDRRAFTQGLVLDGGRLYESTGLVGQSSLREVEVDTGRVIRQVAVPPPIFAEGLALVGERLFQLSWQNGRLLEYDRRSFVRQPKEMTYEGEGWGLCYDGTHLVMSNGSAALTYRRLTDFGTARTLHVTLDGQPLSQLNELECADGAIYANVWMRDLIVRIDPATGRVTRRIDAPNLLSPIEREGIDVMNGIAYDPRDQTFLITGKYWPRLFRVRFVK